MQERISGVDELEALLLVRSDPSRYWTASSVATRLELLESWAGPALEGLCEAGLLESTEPDGSEPRYAYRPATPALESVVTALAGLYDEHRADVLRLLNENAVERIRAAAVRTFGGAFEVSKQKKSGRRRGNKRMRPRKSGQRDGGALRSRRDRASDGGSSAEPVPASRPCTQVVTSTTIARRHAAGHAPRACQHINHPSNPSSTPWTPTRCGRTTPPWHARSPTAPRASSTGP